MKISNVQGAFTAGMLIFEMTAVVLFSFGHCVVYPSSIYVF